jgi:hypothetical protein
VLLLDKCYFVFQILFRHKSALCQSVLHVLCLLSQRRLVAFLETVLVFAWNYKPKWRNLEVCFMSKFTYPNSSWFRWCNDVALIPVFLETLWSPFNTAWMFVIIEILMKECDRDIFMSLTFLFELLLYAQVSGYSNVNEMWKDSALKWKITFGVPVPF